MLLNGVTVSGDWQMINNNSAEITNGLTLSGTLSLGNSTTMGWLNFNGNETLGGTGTVVFGAAKNITSANTYSGLFETANGTLTIGSGITVHGDWGVIGYDDGGQGSASGSVINQGTIAADVSHDVIFLQSSNSQNLGTIEALNAAEFRINGQLTNSGTAFVDSVSALDGNGPSAGGLVGGTVTTQAGAQIANLTLNGITVSGDWQMINNNSALITNGLTLSGTLSLGNSTTMGWLNFNGNETLGGTGTVVLGPLMGNASVPSNGLFESAANGILTLGSGITVHGDWGYIGFDNAGQGISTASIINDGTIDPDNSGDSITVSSAAVTNFGTLESPGGILNVSATTLDNGGDINLGPGSNLSVSGNLIQLATGNFNIALGGSSPNLYGHLAIGGAATLGGTLNITEANGFVPGTGNNFTLLTYPSATGQFSNYTGLELSASSALQPGYNPTSMTLTTVASTTIAPDLRVNNLSITPAAPVSGQNVTVNWNDLNAGNGATNASWTDHVVVTNTTTGQTIATLDVPYDAATSGNIPSNGLSARTTSFQLPNGTAGAGNLTITVTTDYDNTIAEYYPGNVGESNNSSAINFVSTLTAYPDLQVTSPTVATPAPMSGQNITVNWKDSNSGSGATGGNWTDRVTIINTTTGQIVSSGDVPYNAATSGNISAGGNSPLLSATFKLPDGSAGVGSLLVTVTTNVNGDLFEYNASGTATSNNSATTTATSTISPYPDLQVTNLSINPASPVSGQNVTVQWTDANTGNAATAGNWTDHVTVVNTTTGQTLVSTNVPYSSATSGNIAVGSSSPLLTYGFPLPNGAAGIRALQITVTANINGDLFEYNASGTATTNNSTTTTATATIAPYPDLQVTNLAINPTTPISGQSLTISWTDANTGNGSTSGSWSDQVTVVNTTTGQTLATVNVPYDATSSGNLSAGAVSAQRSDSLTLPAGTAGVGQLQITVTADIDNAIFEYNASQTGESNNSATISATSTHAPEPDLTVSVVSTASSAGPGQSVPVNWTIGNSGNADAIGSWVEQIYLATDAIGSNPTLLATDTYSSPIPEGQSISRLVNVTLPPTVSGNYWLVVEENATGSLAESNTQNNSAISAQPIDVVGGLALEIANHTVSTGDGASATTATVSRNTPTTSSLVVAISNSDPTDVTVPATVTIPAGDASATFTIGTINNEIVEGTQTAQLTASASNLASGTDTLTINDINVPTLTLSLSSGSIDENATNPAGTGTVTRNTSDAGPLTVSLASNSTNKLQIPATVTIPAGQTSVTFPLTVVNDYQVDGDATATVVASAPGFVTASNSVTVVDENIPALNLSFAQHSVSEGAGPIATTGIVSVASAITNAPLTISLIDDDTAAVGVPSTVTVYPGQTSATFNVAVFDDGLVTPDKTVTITARVVTTSGTAITTGQSTDTLTVVEHDGPALTLALPVSAIGQGATTQAVLTRNTPTDDPLTVTLKSSATTHATVPDTVTIPAGQSSASFTITGVNDGLPDGTQYAVISAVASGLATALANIAVTSVNLPDLAVTQLNSPIDAAAGSSIEVNWTVTNTGLFDAAGPWTDLIYLDPLNGAQGGGLMATVGYSGTGLAPGADYTASATIALPANLGQYDVRVVADAYQEVEEPSYANNTQTSALNLSAPYTATVSTPLTVPSTTDTPIPLSGHAALTADGSPAINVPVEIRISVDGTSRLLTTTTDQSGNFSATFQPLSQEAGSYSVSAGYPGASGSACAGPIHYHRAERDARIQHASARARRSSQWTIHPV